MQATATLTFRQRLADWIESQALQNAIIAVIVLNAITLGLETSQTVTAHIGGLLIRIEQAVLAIFVVEIAIKLIAFGPRFFRSSWNIFDFVIVGIALVPASGPFAILRALRILRVLRLLTKIERLRHIIESLLKAIPSIGWIVFLLLMVFYIFAVMGTQLFAASFPDQFGHLGRTLYSLFQIMTLESWSQEISRPVMAVYPYAWLYFVTFILITAFVVLNLFIGIIVSTMQEKHYDEESQRLAAREERAHKEREEMLLLIRDISDRLQRMEEKK
ncbi:ion transporter [Marinimicrobium sp. ABcell2]|uniref:ion transporter n=1 Tax=Marinimicrobium sp. ABcell2 TaxID=3069751 RepID=UPI0027AFE52E|nr:ion transporter [Marinimicrobium sp. ABcell2]MDQ2075829.1 ion transporter [Marinimicrobium sp. ABcell2]